MNLSIGLLIIIHMWMIAGFIVPEKHRKKCHVQVAFHGLGLIINTALEAYWLRG